MTKLTISRSVARATLMVVPVLCVCPAFLVVGANAQSLGSFSTAPYQPAPTAPATVRSVPASPVAPPQPTPHSARVPIQFVAPPTNPVAPVVMFKATPPPPRVQPTAADHGRTEPRPYSISWQAAQDATPVLGPPTQLVDQPAPPPSAGIIGEPQRETRGPFRRIYEDTRTGIVRDIPQALADAIPWVDRNRKDEPFNAVLARTADELSRAAARDPEWALPAEDEIRELAQRLSLLTAPPPAQTASMDESRPIRPGGPETRPFRPRPIWPGASGRPEPQSRPLALITSSPEEEGPRVSGMSRPWQSPAAIETGEAPSPAAKAEPSSRQTKRKGRTTSR
jgi:hypothetical protein